MELKASFRLQLLLKSHWEEWVEEELWCFITWEPTPSQLYVQGSFCSSKAETQKYRVFCCQVNVKYKHFLCKGAPVMPVTPNLAFLENTRPRQEDFTKQINPTFC